MIKNINWIDVNEQLPPDNDYKKQYLVTVYCKSWDKKYSTMTMDWECTEAKGKEVRRWKYLGSLVMKAWIITHWAEFPEPAITE